MTTTRWWVFVTFFVEALLCCPVASWCTRNDDPTGVRHARGTIGCSSPFSSRHYPAVRSRLGARGTMTRHPTADARRWVSPFFRRGTTLLSGRVLLHAER
ncbi:hypothetical protein TNCV_1573751 [Trichonephila clavipes]|nr:hypothetical protein TNCV_1573751 [Trichonephila clavipes]